MTEFEDQEISEDLLTMVIEQREVVRGKHPNVKIQAWRKVLGREDDTRDPAALVRLWYRYQRDYIQKKWPIEKYLIKGAAKLFDTIREMKSKDPNLMVVAATANEQDQAEWLLGYAGVLDAFDEVLGYRLDEENAPTTKVEMLGRFLKRHPGVTAKVMIGDGVPDVKAGVANGCVSIGVTGDETALRAAGADYYFNEGRYEDMAALLKQIFA